MTMLHEIKIFFKVSNKFLNIFFCFTVLQCCYVTVFVLFSLVTCTGKIPKGETKLKTNLKKKTIPLPPAATKVGQVHIDII